MSKISAESLSDMVFGFLEDDDIIVPASCSSDESGELDIVDEDEKGKNNDVNLELDMQFWTNQQQLLQATLYRTSLLESRIRSATKAALQEIQDKDIACAYGKTMAISCRNCLMREVSRRLQNAGFKSAVCKTKWRSSSDIPSGEHTFLDVVNSSGPSKKGEMRVIIELTFRAQFEMARASDDYSKLIEKLPEVFVGKVERLQNVIKILCASSKKCMKEKKMHMGPWRKHRYMQAKWLGTCERTTSTSSLTLGYSNKLPKPRASMLTFDLQETLPGVHCTAVEVV